MNILPLIAKREFPLVCNLFVKGNRSGKKMNENVIENVDYFALKKQKRTENWKSHTLQAAGSSAMTKALATSTPRSNYLIG